MTGDFFAGLTVAIILVPQAVRYSLIAGLPLVTDLYASTIPLIMYALFGSSKHLAVGPVAMVSLFVFSIISKFEISGSPEYISFVVIISMISGTGQILLGLLRSGFFVNFISDAVITRFTSAAALIIGIRIYFAKIKGVVRDLFLYANWENCCRQKIVYRTTPQIMDEINRLM